MYVCEYAQNTQMTTVYFPNTTLFLIIATLNLTIVTIYHRSEFVSYNCNCSISQSDL